jgi:hypothetical protein
MSRVTREMLTGVILGDAHLRRAGDKAYITIEQSIKKAEYVNYLNNLFKEGGFNVEDLRTYTRNDARYNKINKSLYFKTESTEELKSLADLFLDNEGKKKIPSNISEYLSLRSLAFWIMDDGQQVKRGGVVLCTDSFKSEEINTLRDALKSNFNLITSIHKKKSNSSESSNIYERIYIKKSSLDEIKPSLKEHMHNSMWYKINETLSVPEKEHNDSSYITDFGSDIGDF